MYSLKCIEIHGNSHQHRPMADPEDHGQAK